MCFIFLFFFSSRRRHTRCGRDWSSDVCSSDLLVYFGVRFDEDLGFDTAPSSPLTHWRSRMFRVPRRACRQGELLNYTISMPDLANVHSWRLQELADRDQAASASALTLGTS